MRAMCSLAERKRAMTTFRKIIYPLQEVLYGFFLVIAILAMCGIDPLNMNWDKPQNRIILVAIPFAMVGILMVPLVEKLLKVRFSGFVDLMIAFDIILGVVLGECLGLYRTVANYDKFLHTFGALQVAILGYALARFFLDKTNKGAHHTLMAILFGFFFAVAIMAIWELYEFTIDCVTKTDMQKFIPIEFEGMTDPETGQILASDEEIANVFREFGGYHFGVMDTMLDIVADVSGSAGGIIISALVFKFRPEVATRLIRSAAATEETVEVRTVEAVVDTADSARK